MDKLKNPYRLLFIYWLFLLFCAFYFNGLGGDGDTVAHFLYAKYAFTHPENFFNHWAKPIYVMLMAPITQLGFTAVKIVNVSLTVLSMFFGLKIGEKMGLRSLFLPLIAFFSIPICLFWSLSGLTEPLFAFWLLLGIYLLFQEKTAWGIVFLSFLPFVRSEGLIIFCVLILFLLVKKEWKCLPLLGVGHLVLGVLGYPVHGRLDWVLTKIPYTKLDGATGYGVGKWDYYAVHFPYIVGPVLTAFVVLGLLAGLVRLIQYAQQKTRFPKNELWLVYGILLAFFIAHSIFWTFGIFNSYGLLRVFLGVVPLIALVAARGMEVLYDVCKTKRVKTVFWALLIPVLVYNIFHKQKWEDMYLTGYQDAFLKFTQKHQKELETGDYTLYLDFLDGYYFLGSDMFDKNKAHFVEKATDQVYIPNNALVIWDKRYSVMDHRLSYERIASNPLLVPFDTIQVYGENALFVFKRKSIFLDAKSGLLVQHFFDADSSEACIKLVDGNYVQMLDEQCKYSKGLDVNTDDVKTQKSVLFSFSVKCVGATPARLSFVQSYEDMAGKSLSWVYEDVQLNDENKDWQRIKINSPLKKEFQNARFKSYLVGESTSVYIDSLEVYAQ